MTVRRFLKTPKGQALIVLLALIALAAIRADPLSLAPGLAGAVGAAMLVDAPILARRSGRLVFPSGALLTGLIVAMILAPQQPWYVGAVTSATAVAGKYIFRGKKANIFNPAAFGLVATFYLFHTAQNWWGALPDLPAVALLALLGAGVYLADRVKRIPAMLAFLGTYYLLITIAAYISDPAPLAELYRTPDLQAALYFAFFMVTDPPTSPPGNRDQVIFGALVGAASFGIFELVGAAYYLLAGLLVANLWEARRRARSSAAKISGSRIAA